MSEFTDIVHHVATIGEHAIEWADGHAEITFNGHTINGAELPHIVGALTEAADALGVVLNVTG